jgi:hypothetical protein
MYVPVHAWLSAALRALVGAALLEGNTTETVRAGKVREVHIPFQMRLLLLLLFFKAPPPQPLFTFKMATAQHAILRNLPNKLVHFLLDLGGPPPASCIQWQAPTLAASEQFQFGTGTSGGYARRVLPPRAVLLCQCRAQGLAWHRDWQHCEIGTKLPLFMPGPDPIVYIVPLSHILGRLPPSPCRDFWHDSPKHVGSQRCLLS